MTTTPAIYVEPNGGGYDITTGVEPTNLPDGYVQLFLIGKHGDAAVASLTAAELAALRDLADALLGG